MNQLKLRICKQRLQVTKKELLLSNPKKATNTFTSDIIKPEFTNLSNQN